MKTKKLYALLLMFAFAIFIVGVGCGAGSSSSGDGQNPDQNPDVIPNPPPNTEPIIQEVENGENLILSTEREVNFWIEDFNTNVVVFGLTTITPDKNQKYKAKHGNYKIIVEGEGGKGSFVTVRSGIIPTVVVAKKKVVEPPTAKFSIINEGADVYVSLYTCYTKLCGTIYLDDNFTSSITLITGIVTEKKLKEGAYRVDIDSNNNSNNSSITTFFFHVGNPTDEDFSSIGSYNSLPVKVGGTIDCVFSIYRRISCEVN